MKLLNIVAVIVVFAAFIALFTPIFRSWFRKKTPARARPHIICLTVGDDAFTIDNVETKASLSVPWALVTRITMITTDQGPFLDDLFYHVVYDGGEVTLPSEAQNMAAFTGHIATLPGFDMTAYAAAIGSTQNNSFVVCYAAGASHE